MTIEEKVAIVQDLVRKHGNQFITIDFVKKDGTLRHLMCHRSKVLESQVKGTFANVTAARNDTLKKRNMIVVEELVKPGCAEHQWRTVNCETVKKIVANGKEHIFD